MKNLLVSTQVVLFVFFSFGIKAQDAGAGIPKNIRVEIQQNVNWIYTLDDKPALKKSLTPVILVTPRGTFNSIRGTAGGKSCGCIATFYALGGYEDAALSWLKAAQSHNPHAMELFDRHPAYTMEKARENEKNCRGHALLAVLAGPYASAAIDFYNSRSN